MSALQQHGASRDGAETPHSQTQASSNESVSVTECAAARSDSFVGSRPDYTAAQDGLDLELDPKSEDMNVPNIISPDKSLRTYGEDFLGLLLNIMCKYP